MRKRLNQVTNAKTNNSISTRISNMSLSTLPFPKIKIPPIHRFDLIEIVTGIFERLYEEIDAND